MADSHGGGVVGMLVRIVCVAGGALVGAFVLALLAPGAGTAHADSGVEPVAASGDAVVDHASDDGAFWALPDSLSSAAARRAVVVVAADAEPDPWVVTPRPADDAPSAPAAATHRAPANAASSIPIGTVGSGGGSTDGGPSISPLAVMASALVAVMWLSQRLRHREARARSAFVTLSLERPG